MLFVLPSIISRGPDWAGVSQILTSNLALSFNFDLEARRPDEQWPISPETPWTENDLAAYNIHVHEQSLKDFFDVEAVENLPGVHPSLDAFATTGDRIDAPDDDTYRLLHFAHIPKIGQEAAVDLFALPIFTCGSTCRAQTGVCVLDSNDMILLLVSRSDNDLDPEPPVIAKAIAAFQHNNSIRERKLHLPVLDQMVFPAMTMSGTCPTFYKVTVSAALNNAVKMGLFRWELRLYTVTSRGSPIVITVE
ncbi:hypothetical protein C8R45DRAFT_1219869 [Mycena sanguinolenta]|nr:hypothetical protein C8R45DRAFT_1219869 [Mycena sanguinolenta]